jgi:isopropylmalate/homocitrate/citramalate synthase
VQKRCEDLGFTLTRQELDSVYRRMIALADQRKTIQDGDIEALVRAVRNDADTPETRRPDATTAQAQTAFDPHATPAEVGYGHGV